ncbi:MAG: hypothetical protein H6704_08315 [Myxococcales bacterium]|nr:hypothetical protein [Myxococcales bacterium]
MAAAAAEDPRGPPAGVIADLGAALTDPHLDLGRAPSAPPALARALADYEAALLGRLLADPHLPALRDALASLPPPSRPAGVGLVTHLLAERLGLDPPGPRAASARALARRPGAEILAAGRAALADDAGLRGALADRYADLARSARRTRPLLSAAEVETVRHFEALRGAGDRHALAQIADLAERVEAALPRRPRPRATPAGHAPDALADDDTFPMGGYAALTTRGGPESLVPSELAYLEPGAEIDLFHVRWAQGELLHYSRDESVHHRPRRRLALVLAADLHTARVTDAGGEAQRLIWALAVAVAGARAWVRWLGDHDLEVRVRVQRAADADPLQGERRLLALLLDARRDVVQVDDGRAPFAADVTLRVGARPDPDHTGPELLATDRDAAAWLDAARELLTAAI